MNTFEFLSNNIVTLAILLPFVCAALLPLCHRAPNVREALTYTISLLTAFVIYTKMLPPVLNGATPRTYIGEIMPMLDIVFWIEPLGMVFGCVVALLWPIASLYNQGYMRTNNEKRQTTFAVCFALSIGSALGIAFAGNLFTLFIFYELLTLCTYPLVTHAGTADARAGGRTYIGILLSTSILFLMFAIIWTYLIAGHGDFSIGHEQGSILNNKLAAFPLGALLFLFMYGIGKAALLPFHSWLPAAMVAPTPVSALLHAVAVVKAGVFCVVKVIVYVFGIDTLQRITTDTWLVYAAGISIIIASLMALKQDNLKKRLAYSTVSQLSYVTMAAAIASPLAIIGATVHIVAHAFGKITLFFVAGSIYTASKKKYISELDGIGRYMPWTMGAFTIGALSMIGLPPLVGFTSKWYIIEGAFQAESYFPLAVIFLSTLLNAAYFIPIIFAAFFKPVPDTTPDSAHGEAPLAIVTALSITAGLTLLTFFAPNTVLALAHQLVE